MLLWSSIKYRSFEARIEDNLNWYHFVGRIVGKAMYEGHLVPVAFAGFFLTKVHMNPLFRGGIDTLFVVARQGGELPR